MDKLEQLLAELAPQIRKAFEAAIADIVDNVILRQVIDAIERGDIEGAFKALGIVPPVYNPLVSVLSEAVNAGGIMMMAQFPKYLADSTGLKTMLRFNLRDRRAEDWLRNKSSGLITTIDNDIRANVRTTLDAGMRAGRNPRSVALDIVGRIDPVTGKRSGGVVGLGEREEYWSRSARRKLESLDQGYFDMELRDKRFDKTVQRAIADGRMLPREVVDKLVDRYRSNALRHRGETIGRTEALAALHYSEWIATKQALEASNLPQSAVRKVWDSTGDARVRSSHKALDGLSVGLDEPFVSPLTGARMMHPGDVTLGAPGAEVIDCRCRIRYDVNWYAGLRNTPRV